MNLNKILVRFNPAVSKYWLVAIAGAMWTGVGIMLLKYAYIWLASQITFISLIMGVAGISVAIFANHFQFSRLAKKNINRIMQMADKACIFSFQAWKGYMIILVMVTGGSLLRHSAIPKTYLAVLYSGIGGALFLSSFQYYFRLLQTLNIRKSTFLTEE
jgi:hypothetical protein